MSNRLIYLLPMLAILVLAALPSYWLMPRGDEALYMLQGKLIAEGQLPYRDFFQFLLPGSLYFCALIFKLSDVSVFAARIAITILQLSAVYALFRMGQSRLGLTSRILLGLFVWFSIITMSGVSHHALAGVLAVWVMYFTFLFIHQKRRRWVILSGLLAGILLLTSQTPGFLIIISYIFVYLWLTKTKTHPVFQSATLLFIFSAALPMLLFVAVLLFTGSFYDFLRDLQWLFQGYYLRTTTLGYFVTGMTEIKNSLFSWDGKQWFFVWTNLPVALQLFLTGWLPVLGILWGIQILIRQKQLGQSLSPSLFLLTISALLLLISSTSYSTCYHISQVSWPGYLLGAMALKNLLSHRPKTSFILKTLACLSLFIIVFNRMLFFVQAITTPSQWVVSYGTNEHALWLPDSSKNTLTMSKLVEFIHQLVPADAPIFVWNASPEFYLLSNHPPATRYPIVIPFYTSSSQIQEITTQLSRKLPSLLLYDAKIASIFNSDPRYARFREQATDIPALRTVINERYRPWLSMGNYTLFLLYPAQRP